MTTRQQQIETARKVRRWRYVADYGWCVIVGLSFGISLTLVSNRDAEVMAAIAAITAVVAAVVWVVAMRIADYVDDRARTVRVAKVINGHTITMTTGMFSQRDVGKEIHFPLPACTEVPRQFVDGVGNGWVDAP